jgi:hypothetical protein
MKRYLFFADFLGTRERYKDIQRVKRVRALLETTVELYFLQYLEKYDLYVYIVSDSLFVTCPKVEHLLLPIAKLFRHFFNLEQASPTKPLQLLMLRGAIGYGEEATTSVLKNSTRIITIPMLDASLPRVTALEPIRPGSRVFLDGRLPRALTSKHDACLLHWKMITGRGDPIPNVQEFLWPCLAYQHQELLVTTEWIRNQWLMLLRAKEWNDKEYRQGLMIQLDETLKLFIRSIARSGAKVEASNYLSSILPQTSNEVANIEFEWGLWFQVLMALSETSTNIDSHFRDGLVVVKKILLNNDYWNLFTTELEKVDYAVFKEAITAFL